MTPRQREYVEAYVSEGSYAAAARKLKIARPTLRETIRVLEANGQCPWQAAAPIPPHLRVGKTTVQYGPDGEVLNEWRRQYPLADAVSDFVAQLCDQVRGKLKAPKRRSRKSDTDDVLYEIDVYDPHIGLYADERETLDADYTTEIAADRMITAVEDLASRATRPHRAVLVFGGDILHSDNRSNTTEASGHILDADTRYKRTINYAVKACREAVQVCASLASEVVVVPVPGNHDWHSMNWMAEVLTAAYEGCPNITIVNDAAPRKHMVFGTNLLVWAHGDKIPATKWQSIIAAEFPTQWGQTKFRHLKLGHIHHKKAIAPIVIEEQAGLLVEFLEALAATDAWHADKGYVGTQKGASAFAYNKTGGLMTRHFSHV